MIHLTRRELKPRPNNAPHDARGPKHLCARTDKPVLLARLAHILDIREHPCLYAELNRARHHRRDRLRAEHRPRRDLHVVAQLEVRGELERLRHSDVPPSLEEHHGNWTARKRVPDNKFRDDVQPDLLVGDSLDHANWNEVDEG